MGITYDGRAGADAADGMIGYINGVAVASTNVTDAGYIATENLAIPPTLGGRDPVTAQNFDGLITGGDCGILRAKGKEYTTAEILADYNLTRPYVTG